MPRRLVKPLVWGAILLPLAKLAVDLARGALAEPVAVALNRLGFWALVWLMVSLACTPAKRWLGWTWPNRVRRLLGVSAFAYALLHFCTYAIVDQELDIDDILADVIKRKFITIGLLTLVLLTPLAITSTDRMVRRLGHANWQRLHRLAYVAAAAGVVHFFWRVKRDLREPLIFAAVWAGLMLARWPTARRSRARAQSARRTAERTAE